MNEVRPVAMVVAALVLVWLGLLTFAYQDSLMTWQPVPAEAAWRMPVIYLSGLVLVLSGVALAIPRWRSAAAGVAAAWLALWAIAFHLPHIFVARDVAALLGFAEAAACALGLATLTDWFDRPRLTMAHRIAFGLCLIVFGASHFVYADFTAAMVPAWLPQRLAIAYLTGTVHALAGICLLAGVQVRVAATIEALMMSAFVLLLHIPGVVAAPHDRLQLTMLGMATLLTCASWLVATWPALRDPWVEGA